MASETVEQSVPVLFLWFQNRRKQVLCAELLRSRKVLNAITEIVFNLLNTIPLTSQNKKALLVYANELLLLRNKGQHQKKYQLLAQDPKGKKLLSIILSLSFPYLLESKSYNGSQ